MNTTYAHLFNVIQQRKMAAQQFLDKNVIDVALGSNVTCFFYVTEALPNPPVLFRFLVEKGTMMFEVYDVVPNSFQLTGAGYSSSIANIFIHPKYQDEENTGTGSGPSSSLSSSSPASYARPRPRQEVRQVNATPFTVFGDKNHQLVATFPIFKHLNFWR